MNFKVFISKPAQKFLASCDKHVSKRILEKVNFVLPFNPVPHDSKRMLGEQGVFRLRIGKYRVIYSVEYSEEKIIILEIGKRENVYS